jgi:FixJ family two-component response regulator
VSTASEPSVYLVDDDDAVRDSLKLLLEAHGMAVRDYGSAQDFLGDIDSEEMGCLILDLHLPVIGGLDLIRIMRQRQIGIPVVFITGRSDKETRMRAMQEGAIAFLEKPVCEASLMTAIEEALARSSGRPRRGSTDADVKKMPERQAPLPF